MKPATLLRLYPRKWRDRYGDEFLALLQDSRPGFRVLVDVVVAAAREWTRVLTPTFAKFVGLYSLIWLTVLGMQAMMGLPHPLHFFAISDQGRFLGTFLWSAMVARFVDNQILDGSPAPTSKLAVQILGALENLAAIVVVYACWSVAPHLVAATPIAIMIVLSGNLFGRRPEMMRVLNQAPGWTPRPPSFTGLGLSS